MSQTISVDVPRCPNHGEPLELDLSQMTAIRGHAPCPVSKALFEFSQSPQAKSVDKYGNPSVEFVVTGND